MRKIADRLKQMIGGLAVFLSLSTLIDTLIWVWIWHQRAQHTPPPQRNWQTTVIFLTGISDLSEVHLHPEQSLLLKSLAPHIIADQFITDNFPYEKETPRQFARLDWWLWLGYPEAPIWYSGLHNFWQTAFATWLEGWYGPLVTRCVINRVGLRSTHQTGKLIFICGSAGVALALAAAPYLRQELKVEIEIIGYGGMFGPAKGFDHIERVTHWLGNRDWWARLPCLIFASRCLWPHGAFGRAVKSGRFRQISSGPHWHYGVWGYTSIQPSPVAGKNYQDILAEKLSLSLNKTQTD